MIKRQLLVFLLRTAASGFGLWLCVRWFGQVSPLVDLCPDGAECITGGTPNPLLTSEAWMYYAVAGLVFSLCNSIVKPLAKVMMLPLAILTMGISTVLINLGMLWITFSILPGVEVSFWSLTFASVVLSLINSLVNFIMPSYNK